MSDTQDKATPSKGKAATKKAQAQSRRELLKEQREAQARKDKNRMRLIIGVGALVIALIVALVVWMVVQANKPVSIDGAPPHAVSNNQGIKPFQNAKPDAPKVIIYSDFQCPGCAALETTYGDDLFKNAEDGTIDLEIRTLTFLDANFPGQHSERAAVAAACSDNVGLYSKVYKAIYSNQPQKEGAGYSDQVLLNDVPELVKMTPEQKATYTNCYSQGTTRSFAQNVNKQGNKTLYDFAGRVSTPSIIVNGKVMDLAKVDAKDPSSLVKQILAAK